MDEGLPTKGFEELLGDALGGAFSDYRSCSQLQEEVVSFPHSFLYHLPETCSRACSNLYDTLIMISVSAKKNGTRRFALFRSILVFRHKIT